MGLYPQNKALQRSCQTLCTRTVDIYLFFICSHPDKASLCREIAYRSELQTGSVMTDTPPVAKRQHPRILQAECQQLYLFSLCPWATYLRSTLTEALDTSAVVQGYLAHGKQPPSLGSPQVPRFRALVGSWEGGGSYERGAPVQVPGKAWTSLGGWESAMHGLKFSGDKFYCFIIPSKDHAA